MCTPEFIEYVCSQIDCGLSVRSRKMFGEYMIYVNEKPILLVCNNTVYVKMLDCFNQLLEKCETGIPYDGSKPHYMLDPEDKELFNAVLVMANDVLPMPKKKPASSKKKQTL